MGGKILFRFCFGIRTISSEADFSNTAPHYSESNHPAMRVRDGETWKPLWNTGERGWKGVGSEDGSKMQERAGGQCWGAEGTRMLQPNAEVERKQLY